MNSAITMNLKVYGVFRPFHMIKATQSEEICSNVQHSWSQYHTSASLLVKFKHQKSVLSGKQTIKCLYILYYHTHTIIQMLRAALKLTLLESLGCVVVRVSG